MRLAGKVAIVTGSTKGIGVGIAERFAAEGATVVVSGRTVDKGEEVAARITEAGGVATFVPCDLGDTSQCRALVDAAVSQYGGVDVLVNNAAPLELITGGSERPIADQTPEEFESFIRIALLGTAAMIRYAVPPMLERGGGSIVNISSGSSVMGVAGTPGYSAAKGAINALSRQVAVDYGLRGIRCNTIIVGLVAIGEVTLGLLENPVFEKALKSMTVSPRLGTPGDIAEGALYLASDAAEWVSGSMLTIDGGASIKTPVPEMSG
ncbi:MAG: SDR family NAD(P)-dependent oxidoreductase [Aeromicrobium sp.]